MSPPTRLLVLSLLLFPAAAHSGPVDSGTTVAPASGQDFAPAFDALVGSAEFEGRMDFDSSAAELEASRYMLTGFLMRPVDLGNDWKFLPAFEYSFTSLDVNHASAALPLDDEDLQHLGLHAIFYHKPVGSRWIFGGWGRANLASDFQQVNSDDFYFDLAAGAGYQVTDRLLLGAGVAALELGSDGYVLPGPGIYWKPTDEIDVQLIGALFDAIWRPSDEWVLALRAQPFGSTWNIDSNNQSRQVDLRSYTLRLHAERRLCRDMWLSLGVGFSFANQLELRTPSGQTLFKDDLGSGLSASVGLRVRTW